MLLETLRASVYCKGLGLWLMSGVSLPHAASSLQLIPAINPVSPPFLGRYQFILFLSKLVKSTDGPVVVITDNLSVHHGKRVKAWVEEQPNLTLEFIPSYSPELNADEYLNRDLKKNVNAKRMPRNLAELKANVMSFMLSIQKQPERIMNYFNGKKIAYAS